VTHFLGLLVAAIFFLTHINPLPPSDAVRKQKKNSWDLFNSILSLLKKYHPSGSLKFNNFGIFQSLKLRILVVQILPISLKLKFTPYTLDCYGLTLRFHELSAQCVLMDFVQHAG